MLEPQSTALFLLLMAAFGGLVLWAVLAKQAVFRLLAACLAFIPAMLFGVVAVNKYYGYYVTWSAVRADFTGGGVQNIPHIPAVGPASVQAFDHLLGKAVNAQQAALTGAEIGIKVRGSGMASGIVRQVIIYLPPQYFQKPYANYRFPAIELIHGQPGGPRDWMAALNVPATLQELVAAHRADPVVLVMPDVNGKRTISLQCLNQVGGPADETFIANDVPSFVAARIRVEPPGKAWGIAGYSEGGYCAANLAIRDPRRYGFVGVMSGYFTPDQNRLEFNHVFKHIDPFHGNAVLRMQNSPEIVLQHMPAGIQIPQFWIGAARASRADVVSALSFVALLRKENPGTPLTITPQGAHNAVAWRSMIPLMLEWMTPRLAEAAAAFGCTICASPSGSPGPALPSSPGSLTQPSVAATGAVASQGRTPAHAQLTAGAAQPAGPGAARLPGTVLPSTG